MMWPLYRRSPNFLLSVTTIPQKNDGSTESTEILRGSETVMNGISQFLSKVKDKIDSCGDSNGPSIAIGVQEYKELLLDIKARHIKFRYITEITKENIHYCKELMEFADEIRHLDGIKANFSVSETEYMAYTTTAAATPIITT